MFKSVTYSLRLIHITAAHGQSRAGIHNRQGPKQGSIKQFYGDNFPMV